MTVKIKGSFKKKDGIANGLNAIETELRDTPLAQRYVVGVITTARYGQDLEKDERDTVVKFELIEPLEGDAALEGKRLLEMAYNARTGRPESPQEPLPFGDEPQRDPAAGPWPGDVGYPTTDQTNQVFSDAETPATSSDEPDEVTERRRRGSGR